MVQRIEDVTTLQESINAKSRRSQNHIDGFVPIQTNETLTGFRIIWDNTPGPPPPPRRQLTERQVLEEVKPQDVDII